MQLFHNLDEWQKFRSTIPHNKTIGFVPTMGNLHAGHASLFTQSINENDYTVSSLFVNPTQFNNHDDYQNYPRTVEHDIELMKTLGVDYCLLPEEKSIYKDGYQFQIHENKLCQLMEGQHRPGHFNGVLTIVMKLLNLTRPTKAYFGEKDYQQYLLIKEMVTAFFMAIEIIPCPTIRENSGLAFSSRNNRLTPEQKQLAERFAQVFHQHQSCAQIIQELNTFGILVEYIEEHFGRRFAAVKIGEIRLIDNYSIVPSSQA